MKIVIENDISLSDFEAWSGAVSTLDTLIEKDLCDTVEAVLEDIYPDGMSDTQLNDILWFECDTIAEWCGFSNWEELEKGEEDMEEELNEAIETGIPFDDFCHEHRCENCPLKNESDCEGWYKNMTGEDDEDEDDEED